MKAKLWLLVAVAIFWVDLLLLINLVLLKEHKEKGGDVTKAVNRVPIINNVAASIVGKQNKDEYLEVEGLITSELERNRAYMLKYGENRNAVVTLREHTTMWKGLSLVEDKKEMVGKSVRVYYFAVDRVKAEPLEGIAAQIIVLE